MNKKHFRRPNHRVLALMTLAMLWINTDNLQAAGHINMEAARKEARVTLYSSISLEDINILTRALREKTSWHARAKLSRGQDQAGPTHGDRGARRQTSV